jgi:hypothetical protein
MGTFIARSDWIGGVRLDFRSHRNFLSLPTACKHSACLEKENV